MAFMELYLTQKGRLASIECSRCGHTNYWHEWANEGQAEDLCEAACEECFHASLNPDTYWESPSRNYYAGRYSADGYMDCTSWNYGKNKRALIRELKELYEA